MSVYLNNNIIAKRSSIGPTGPQGPIGQQGIKGDSYDNTLINSNDNLSVIQMTGKRYEYHTILSDTFITLPDISNIDSNKCIEYHLFLNFTGDFLVILDEAVKCEKMPETSYNGVVEYIIKLLNFGTSHIWICDIVNYN